MMRKARQAADEEVKKEYTQAQQRISKVEESKKPVAQKKGDSDDDDDFMGNLKIVRTGGD